MTLIDHVPLTRKGIGTALAGGAVLWISLYLLNENVWDWILYGGFGMTPHARATESVHFFLYDTIKIALLLVGIIFAVTVLRSYMSVERTRALLGGKREGVGNLMAAGLGGVTPFCSCSAVPAFIGFVSAGVPIGVTLSFLIASPLVNEIAVGMLWVMFGWKVALLYLAAGLTIATAAGWVLGRMRVERWVELFVFQVTMHGRVIEMTSTLTLQQRVQIAASEVGAVIRKIWPYLLVGVGIGAMLHGWVPADFFATYAGANNPLGVVVAVGAGIPLYSSAAGVMPLVEVLFDKGLPMGTLLAFMMSVVALSLPEMILLKRVLKLPLIGIFAGVVAVSIVAVGYLFNVVLA
jgi:uncharacterized membrane protein YraQ (UPF0718 family)